MQINCTIYVNFGAACVNLKSKTSVLAVLHVYCLGMCVCAVCRSVWYAIKWYQAIVFSCFPSTLRFNAHSDKVPIIYCQWRFYHVKHIHTSSLKHWNIFRTLTNHQFSCIQLFWIGETFWSVIFQISQSRRIFNGNI